MRRSGFGVLVLATALAFPVAAAQPAVAQDLRVATPYPSVSVEAGDRVTLTLEVFADTPTSVALAVTDAPEEWETLLRGGGFVVGGVYADPEEPPEVELETTVPPDVAEGVYTVEVTASGAGATDVLDIEFVVQEAVAGEVALTAEFPTLRGPADTTFSFDLELDNATPQEHTFALAAAGPEGWQVTASPAGEGTAATVTVPAGETESVAVEAVPPPGVTADTYPIAVRATGGGETVEAELEVEVTGTFDLVLATPDDLLSVDTTPGRAAAVTLLVRNEGSAPLQEVGLEDSAPSGWETAFTPEVVDVVQPGGVAEVRLEITPTEDAIVGDYRVTVTAEAPEAADEVDVRVSVETSRAWGAVGITLIAAALGGLGWVFRTFGRR